MRTVAAMPRTLLGDRVLQEGELERCAADLDRRSLWRKARVDRDAEVVRVVPGDRADPDPELLAARQEDGLVHQRDLHDAGRGLDRGGSFGHHRAAPLDRDRRYEVSPALRAGVVHGDGAVAEGL